MVFIWFLVSTALYALLELLIYFLLKRQFYITSIVALSFLLILFHGISTHYYRIKKKWWYSTIISGLSVFLSLGIMNIVIAVKNWH
jgi:hypothetical protein